MRVLSDKPAPSPRTGCAKFVKIGCTALALTFLVFGLATCTLDRYRADEARAVALKQPAAMSHLLSIPDGERRPYHLGGAR